MRLLFFNETFPRNDNRLTMKVSVLKPRCVTFCFSFVKTKTAFRFHSHHIKYGIFPSYVCQYLLLIRRICVSVCKEKMLCRICTCDRVFCSHFSSFHPCHLSSGVTAGKTRPSCIIKEWDHQSACSSLSLSERRR